MRRLAKILMFTLLVSLTVAGQSRTFTKDDIEFALELPSTGWQPVARLDVHNHVDFVYAGAAANGHLRLRKKLVAPGTAAANLFREDEKWKLQELAGYVACSKCEGEKVEGLVNATSFSYEYVADGKPMSGQIYYLKMNNQLFYVLHFTAAGNRLASIQSDIDFIVRSFRLKS